MPEDQYVGPDSANGLAKLGVMADVAGGMSPKISQEMKIKMQLSSAGSPGLARWKEFNAAVEVASSFGALQKERFARSVWQANRNAMDAPHWLGLKLPRQEPIQAEEEEWPQGFGIKVGAVGSISGLSSVPNRKGAQAGTQRGLLRFPAVDRTRQTMAVPHRTRDAVLPFRAPAAKQTIVIFSLVGGVGGTSLAAAVARMLSNCEERVLLADARGHSLLPRYFGGEGAQQGVIRRFAAQPDSTNETISMVSLNIEDFVGIDEEQERILFEFNKEGAAVDRVVWDLGGAPTEWSARVMHQNVRILVPLVPTAQCLLQLMATEQILQKMHARQDRTGWQYVLNQFDDRDPAHVDIRSRFRKLLGERLLPFMLRSSPLVDEALLHGRTIVDHAPASPLVMDLWRLVRCVAALPQAYPEIVPGAWGEN
jgi:cellulose biosynthesis protein BcsQ